MRQILPEKVSVLDVTLRDGLQHEEMFVPTDSKLWVAEKLIDAGFKRIEVGTFSHIEYVPQFKDILELLKRLPNNPDIEYTVLALNTKACQRVAEALDAGVKIDRVLCGQLATSEAYARKNMNRTQDELFKEAIKNLKYLHNAGIKNVFANIGTIFGCPVQGDVPIEKAYQFVDRAFDAGFDEVEHSDTEGVATPVATYEYFSKIMERYPDVKRHSFHVHDIRGMGMAAYYAAMEAGVAAFDCTMGGIGGQVANIVDNVPVKGTGDYYFANNRTGLVDTCDFVTMLNAMKVETGIEEEKCYKIENTIERILGRKLDSFTSAMKRNSSKGGENQ